MHTLVVAMSDKLCGRQEQPFVNRVCMKLEFTLRKSPIKILFELGSAEVKLAHQMYSTEANGIGSLCHDPVITRQGSGTPAC